MSEFHTIYIMIYAKTFLPSLDLPDLEIGYCTLNTFPTTHNRWINFKLQHYTQDEFSKRNTLGCINKSRVNERNWSTYIMIDPFLLQNYVVKRVIGKSTSYFSNLTPIHPLKHYQFYLKLREMTLPMFSF